MHKFNCTGTLVFSKFSNIAGLSLAAAVFVLSGCSSTPINSSLLDAARSDYSLARRDPQVADLAALELRQAGEALDRANAASSNRESVGTIDRLAYLSSQKTAVAQEVAKQRAAETAIANASKERAQILLDQRTIEANRARRAEDVAMTQAKVAQATTEGAQRSAAEAQRKADDAKRDAAESDARARQLELQLADLAAQKSERGMIITLGDLLFDVDQAHLTPDGVRRVQKLADVLKQNPQRAVVVEGYTDSTGSAGHNQELSERRAYAVVAALLEMGVSRDRIMARGYGAAYPVGDNVTAIGRQLNRRVEVILSEDGGKFSVR